MVANSKMKECWLAQYVSVAPTLPILNGIEVVLRLLLVCLGFRSYINTDAFDSSRAGSGDISGRRHELYSPPESAKWDGVPC